MEASNKVSALKLEVLPPESQGTFAVIRPQEQVIVTRKSHLASGQEA
jgi:hypothetical protein